MPMSRGLGRFTGLCACAVLGACATTRLYVPPPGTDGTARIRFSTDSVVRIVPARECLDYEAPRAGLGPVVPGKLVFSTEMTHRKLGMPFAQEAETSGLTSSELRVVAGEPLLIAYEQTVSAYPWTYTCDAYFLFTPKEGIDYQAVSRSTPRAQACGHLVYAIGDASGPWNSPVKIENAYVPSKCEPKKAAPPPLEEGHAMTN